MAGILESAAGREPRHRPRGAAGDLVGGGKVILLGLLGRSACQLLKPA